MKALFDQRSKFTKAISPTTSGQIDASAEQQAYEQLVQTIKVFIEKMTRLHKNKYMRERLYYKNEQQIVLFEEAN